MKATPYMYRHGRDECSSRLVHLASIDVKSEDSFLLEETVTRSRHSVLKEICGALCIVLVGEILLGLVFWSQVAKDENCDL